MPWAPDRSPLAGIARDPALVLGCARVENRSTARQKEPTMTLQPTHNVPLVELDRQSFLHPYTALADHHEGGVRVITEGQGVWLTDLDGVRYIDAAAGLWCVNIGYGRREVADAIYAQAKKLPFFHAFSSMGTEPSIRLADRLTRLAPEGLSRVFFGNSGSDANDTNVKLVWYYNYLRGQPEKLKIISRKGGYHGVTVAAGSLTGIEVVHKGFNLPIKEVRHTTCPDLYRGKPTGMSERDYSRQLAAELEDMIQAEGPETCAAFIAEPVMGTGGVHIPPEGYFEEIQAVLDRHDMLMIADEVICGFGRLGSWFGSYLYNIRPDIMTIAKGLTSAYMPMSASLIHERIWQVMLERSRDMGVFGHGFTYSAHPIAAAAAMANLDIIEGEDLVGNAERTGGYFQRRMRETFADHPLVGDIRGEGLMMGVELVADKARKTPLAPAHRVPLRVMKAALAEGLILRGLPGGNTIAFSPPLVISEGEVEQVVERFAKVLNGIAEAFRSEGIWRG
jgi:L-2,4-diaminobutyrate transaminase